MLNNIDNPQVREDMQRVNNDNLFSVRVPIQETMAIPTDNPPA